MNGMRPEMVSIGTDGKDLDSIVVHDETNLALAFMLGNFEPPMPVPIGVFYASSRPTYDAAMNKQIADSIAKTGKGDPQKLLNGGDTWTVN